jgi:hypothetical protein
MAQSDFGSLRPSRWKQFRALTPKQRQVLLVASIALPVFWIGLTSLGLARLLSWLPRGRVERHNLVDAAFTEMCDVADAVNIAARHSPFPSTCLTRSTLLQWMLNRQGVDSDLRIGVKLIGGKLEAHAWVEHDGVPINDKATVTADFAPFDQPISISAFSAQ